MSVFWTVVLLSSLLAPSQGFILPSLVARGDTDGFKGSPAGHVPQRPQGGLLGGNLLGGLLGKKGAVGSLLGKNGALGSLLNKDGAVGSLLKKDGAVGGLLDGNGLLGGLLGGDGLLGEDGLLGGLLGGDGLLGEDGLLGGLLGGDGLLGSLLDRNGVLSGVLGENGVIDGLLGEDGVVDSLLGKDGLVNSLLDAVLELLIGKNGLLSKNGLVGSLLGRNGEELMGLRIVNNTLPKISLRSLPGFGHQVDFNTQLLVESTSVPGQPLCKQVEVDATMLVQDTWSAHQSNMDCKTVDINTHVSPRVPILDEPLKRLLSDVLSDLGCNVINARLNVVNSLLGSRNQMLPLGALGDLPPFSILSSDSIQLDLNLLSGNAEGGTVASAQQQPLAATLLLATGRPPQLRLSQDTLSALLEQIQGQGALDLTITDSLMSSQSPLQGQVPESTSLSVSALFPFIPQLAQALPGSLPLELRVRMRDEPVVAVRDGKATVTLKASTDVHVPALQTSEGLLFSLDMDIVLNVTPSVSDGKLQTSLALDSIEVTRFPQKLNPSPVSSLKEWLKPVLMTAYIPDINDAISVALPLPNILNVNLRNAEVSVTDEDEFPGQTTLERYCSGGASMLLPL